MAWRFEREPARSKPGEADAADIGRRHDDAAIGRKPFGDLAQRRDGIEQMFDNLAEQDRIKLAAIKWRVEYGSLVDQQIIAAAYRCRASVGFNAGDLPSEFAMMRQ